MSRWAFLERLLRALAHLPLPVTHALGAALGAALHAAGGRERRVTETNLALCLPALSDRERRELARRSLKETGKALLEAGTLMVSPPARVERLTRAVKGERLLHDAYESGRGVILLAPHMGAWESVNVYLSSRYPLTNLYRPPRLAEAEAFLRQARQRAGARLVPTTASGVKALYQALAAGELVGILPDQDPGKGAGVFAPFFGVPAYTMSLAPRLAHRTGARVLVVYAERLPRGRGFRLQFAHPPAELGVADPVAAATALNAAVEECVRQLPNQYQWSYKRFKTRPPGEPPLYHRR